jgi:hypothetical protein
VGGRDKADNGGADNGGGNSDSDGGAEASPGGPSFPRNKSRLGEDMVVALRLRLAEEETGAPGLAEERLDGVAPDAARASLFCFCWWL